MPYCRRCGTKLEDDEHFCHKCGTPVIVNVQPMPIQPPKPIKSDPVILSAIILSTILIVGVVVFALLSAPFATVNVNQTFQDNTVDVNKLNLNVQIDGAKVNVITQNVNNNNFLISIQGSGSKRLFGGDSGSPVQVELFNDTASGVLTVTAKITDSTVFSRFNLNCNVYVNPALTLNVNVTSKAGQLNLTGDKPAIFESLNLQSNAGSVEANLQNATISGKVSLKTLAGTVYFGVNQANVLGNQTVDLHSNAGTVRMDITQTNTLQGNLQVNAATELGSVDVGLRIDGDVAAKVTSKTNLGSINVNVQNFSGDKSPIQSNNYPAGSNIEIDCRTNLGSVNINGQYQSTSDSNIRN